MQQAKKIVILAGKGLSTNAMCNALVQQFSIAAIVIEEPVPMRTFLKKRLKKLGLLKVTGQILFQATIAKWLSLVSQKRVQQIFSTNSLKANFPVHEKIIEVGSVNDESCFRLLQEIQPDIVVVNGTRIISKQILSSINAVFINTHAGITPLYRGVHGAYWALVQKDKEHCGVTVHLVDPGIDTGGILYQTTVDITNEDNFITYPFLQLAAGIPLMIKAIETLTKSHPDVQSPPNGQSQLWTHPTLLGYLRYRLKGIK